jgi:translation initiation factor 2D
MLSFLVYTLWQVPMLLPSLTIHAPVSQFVLNGADVMLPGVISCLAEAKTFQKRELRSVFVGGNPMPIAVGEMLVDAQDIEKQGFHGKAMKVYHVFMDQLWKLGSQTVPNTGFQADHVQAIDETEALEQEAENVISVEELTLEEKLESEAPDIDELLRQSLMQCLKKHLKPKDLPMLSNVFYASFLLGSRPVGSHIDLKQTSFKKLSTFLKEMEKQRFLEVHDKDGVQTIVSFRRSHPYVVEFEIHLC